MRIARPSLIKCTFILEMENQVQVIENSESNKKILATAHRGYSNPSHRTRKRLTAEMEKCELIVFISAVSVR
jgi:hypothetical protein